MIVAIQGLYAAESTARGSARIAERNAVKALQDHIQLHGCRVSQGVKATVGLRSRLQHRLGGRPRSSESTRFLR